MNSPRNITDCSYYYYSTCSKGERCKFRHEPSAMDCEVVCRFWKRGMCANQHCKFRHTELGNHHKITSHFRKNKPRRHRKRDNSSQHEDPTAIDCAAASVRNNNAENGPRARILSKTANRDSSDSGYRVLTLDEIRRHKRRHKEGRCSDTEETAIVMVTSNKDIADGVFSANKLNSGCVAEHGDVISEAMQNGCNSDYGFQHSRYVFGDKVTVTYTKINSECRIQNTSAESVKTHTVAKDKSPGDNMSNNGSIIPNVRSLLARDLSLKLSYENTGTEVNLTDVSDGKNFLMPDSNINEMDCFDQTNQIEPDRKRTKIIRQLKRKNTNYSFAPPPKRPRLDPHTADSPRYSVDTAQKNCSSELSKKDLKFCLDPGESGCFGLGQPRTFLNGIQQCSVPLESSSLYENRSNPSCCTVGSVVAQSIDLSSPTTSPPTTSSQLALTSTIAICVLDGKEEGGAVTQLLASRTEQEDKDIDEEMLLGYEEDNISPDSETEENILLQIDDILND